MMRTIAHEPHVLQCLTDLHCRQPHLSAEACYDVGGGEIYGFLVVAGLAVSCGDELTCEVRSLICAVADVRYSGSNL